MPQEMKFDLDRQDLIAIISKQSAEMGQLMKKSDPAAVLLLCLIVAMASAWPLFFLIHWATGWWAFR